MNYHYKDLDFNNILDTNGSHYEINDVKNKDKSIENFYSHCVDSFILAKLVLENKYNIEFSKEKLNTNLIIKSQLEYQNKRVLYQFKNKIGEKKYYKKIGKRGKIINRKEYYSNKIRKLRIKFNNCKSNHLKNWEYKYSDKVLKFRKFKKFHSDSIVRTKKSTYFNGKNLGKSKRWLFGNIYKNYNIKYNKNKNK